MFIVTAPKFKDSIKQSIFQSNTQLTNDLTGNYTESDEPKPYIAYRDNFTKNSRAEDEYFVRWTIGSGSNKDDCPKVCNRALQSNTQYVYVVCNHISTGYLLFSFSAGPVALNP